MPVGLMFNRLTELPDFLDHLFLEFEKAFCAAPFKVTRRIGSETFDCRTYDEHFLTFIETALIDNSFPRTNGECQVLVAHGGSGGLPFPPTFPETYLNDRSLQFVLASTSYRASFFVEKSFWQFFDLSTKRGIQLMARPDLYPDWEPGAPLRNFLHWHFASLGMRLVHAGTLAEKESGVLLAGSGGAGKSGTVVGGLLSGLQSVGDDYVLISRQPEMNAFPLFTTLKQDPEGCERMGLPHLLGNMAPLNWQGKHQFYRKDIAKGVQPPAIKVKALCIPQITGENKTHIHPASHKEGFLALAPSGISQTPSDRDEGFAFYANLARELPCFKIKLGTDPLEISAVIRELIRSLPE